jgi:hypothetical protein
MPSGPHPSKARDRYWIHAENSSGSSTENSGKWLLFIPLGRIDVTWELIRRETEAGRLGIAAKAATALENPLAKNQSTRLICVYTYNSEDLEDVRRVRQRLRELGFTRKIPYKTDQATRTGKYTSTTKDKISMLFE